MTARTLIEVLPGRPGAPAVRLETGLLSPRLLGVSGDDVRVALIATTALLLAGDTVRVEVLVGPGCRLHLSEVAGTVAYDGRGGSSGWEVAVELAAGAVLTWPGEPFVISAGADVTRQVQICMVEGSRALLREVLVLGRTGERPGRVRCHTRVDLCDPAVAHARPVLVEDLHFSPETALLPGILGHDLAHQSRVLDTVTALGWRPETTADGFDLALPGAVSRRRGDAAHSSDARAVFDTWAVDLARNPT